MIEAARDLSYIFIDTGAREPYKTPAGLNGDTKWTKLRDARTLHLGEKVPA